MQQNKENEQNYSTHVQRNPRKMFEHQGNEDYGEKKYQKE
jgi:hypothetical protein